MSQYTEFFVRNKEGAMVEFAAYGRNSTIANLFSGKVPYGKVKQITIDFIGEMRERCAGAIANNREDIEDCERRIGVISKMENSIDEKLLTINEILDEENYYNDEIDGYNYASHFLDFLVDMMYTADDNKVYCGIEVEDFEGIDDAGT